MGIDVYMKWRGQTEDEVDEQMTGFRLDSGAVGYLREAYHGEPYVTQYLLREAWEGKTEFKITCKDLLERLPHAINLAIEREKAVYKSPFVDANHPSVKSFRDFVQLAVEKELELGEPVTVYVSY